MPRICIVQNLLPQYSISFFNRITELYPKVELIVLADIKQRHALNQYSEGKCKFKVIQLDNVERFGISYRPKILDTLRKLGPEVIVFSGSVRDLSQLNCMIFLKFKGIRFFAWGMFHRVGGTRFLTNLYFRICGLIAQKCLTYTRVGATNLLSLGVHKHKIAIVGTAIDENAIRLHIENTSQDQIIRFKRAHGLENKHVILQVVRLSSVKHPELLVYAAGELLQKRNDLSFVIIGEGEMRSDLEGLVSKFGVQDSFKFIGSLYDEAQLSLWFLSSKLFVVPTFIGLSAHHAMMYGLPIVTDDSLDSQGSEFSILANGLNSLTYEEGNANDLAQKIEVIIDNHSLHSTMSKNAKITIEEVHNLDRKTSNFIDAVLSN